MNRGSYMDGWLYANAVARNYGVNRAMDFMRKTEDSDHKAGQCDALIMLVSTDPRRGVSRG